MRRAVLGLNQQPARDADGQERDEMMEHITKFIAGHDCIRFECAHGSSACAPGAGGSHGRGGMKILFVSKGGFGAVQFLIDAGWLPQKVQQNSIAVRDVV